MRLKFWADKDPPYLRVYTVRWPSSHIADKPHVRQVRTHDVFAALKWWRKKYFGTFHLHERGCISVGNEEFEFRSTGELVIDVSFPLLGTRRAK